MLLLTHELVAKAIVSSCLKKHNVIEISGVSFILIHWKLNTSCT